MYSFVLHTHSPLNSDASVGLIELVPGLGESLVSGRRVFSGYSHQFSFNYRTGELKKQHTLSKNFIAGINKVIATAEVKDTLSGNSSVTTEIRACISNIFTDSQKLIEVFNNHQDVEGLILLDKSTYKYIIVQSRNQPKVTDMSSVNPRDKKKTNKNVSSEAHIDPISHINPVDKDAYTVSSFKNKKINLIDLYIETCGKVYGKDNSIVMPYGSSYNMAQNKTILWEYVKDLDVNVFLLNKTCPYETKQLDTAHVEKFNGYFQKLALKNGLKVTNHEMITAISRAITMAEKANFNAFNYFSHTPVLTTAVLEKLTFSTIAEAHSQELLLTRVTEYISNYRLSNDASVYYIRKFVDESDFGLKLIILFIYAHLTGTKLYCCLEYAWSDFSKNLYEVFKELKLISNAITYEAFLIDVFLNLTVEDILCPLENVHVHYLKHKNNIALGKDLFSKYILKHSDIRNTIFLTDHLDVSTIMETLVYLNHNKVTCDFKLALDKIKVPYTSKDFTCARLNGELKKAQIFYFLIKRYIKDIKHNKISELEAANYFRENNVILKLNATLKELFEDKHSIGDFANKSIKVLQNSENILTAIKEQGDLSKYYSYFKNICIVDITDLPDDTQLIFSSAPRKAAVYILYRPVKNKNNKIVGYDYINVGKDPDSEVSIFGLRDLLTVIEMLFKTESKVCNYQNVWVSHGMYASMVRGPSSSTCENCSIITPLNLAELLYKYVLFTRKNSSIANIERFDSFYDKLLEFLYSDVMISILKKIALNTLKLGFDNIELIRSFDTFHLSFLGMGGKEQTVEIEFKNTNVLPFTWYFSTGYAKKLKRDLWDWTPKGYFYWHSYYGTHKAIHYFENFLKRNLGKITKTDIKESINFTFSAKRYNTSEDVFINESIPERIRIVKELIRLSKVLKDEEIANTCLNLIPKITDAKVDPSNIFEKIRAIDIKIEKEKEELVGELQE